jgi:NAD-dependent deacetylase
MSGPADALVKALQVARESSIVVTTGAGISLASGIPTFRGQDPGAVWKRDVTELGTFRYFREDPAGSWRWYLSRFARVGSPPALPAADHRGRVWEPSQGSHDDRVFAARPNPAHLALAALQTWQRTAGGRFLLITQNIDTLHEQAGSLDLVKVHGSADRVRCVSEGCRFGAPKGSLARADVDLAAFVRDPVVENLPLCPACGSLLRQHVLWFDECYDSHADYQWDRVCAAAADAELFIFVGTSFSVGVTELLVESALSRGKSVFSIDPHARAPIPGVIAVRAPSETLLPEVLRGVGISGRDS